MKKKWAEFLTKLKELTSTAQISNQKMAWSIALGLGSVFLPFPGVQTPFVMALAWVMRLYLPLVYLVNWINNPVTLLPIAMIQFSVGMALSGEEKITLTPDQLMHLQWREWLALGKPFVLGSLVLVVGVTLLAYLPSLWWLKRFRKKTEAA